MLRFFFKSFYEFLLHLSLDLDLDLLLILHHDLTNIFNCFKRVVHFGFLFIFNIKRQIIIRVSIFHLSLYLRLDLLLKYTTTSRTFLTAYCVWFILGFYSFLTLRDNKLFNILFVSNMYFLFAFKIDHYLRTLLRLVTNIDLDLIVGSRDKDG